MTPPPTPTTNSLRQSIAANRWLLGVIVVQIACQLALLSPTLGPLRIVFRTAAFGISILALLMVPPRDRNYPPQILGLLALVILALGMFNPGTTSTLAGFAQIMLNVAILAPMFWVPRLNVTPTMVYRIFGCFWIFHSASAAAGVLQMYYPGQFQPNVSDIIESMGANADGLQITLASGEKVWRPMGLTDTPGGAAMSGLYAFIFGMGYFSSARRPHIQALGIVSMLIGLFCIYLSQVRSILVLAGIVSVSLIGMQILTGRYANALRLSVALPGAVIASFLWAISIGGDQAFKRMETLVDGDPAEVYHSNRGKFVEHTIEHVIPEYPLGCGLGRWGMMSSYFGNPGEPNPVWVEVQWTAWAADGGVPLIMISILMLLTALAVMYRCANSTVNPELATWASLILAYDIAALALTFNYPIFIGQGGLEFWLLNAAVFTATVRGRRG